MARKNVKIRQFNGGYFPFKKAGSMQKYGLFLKNLNIHEDPFHVTFNPKPTKVSGETLEDTIKWIEDGTPYDTNRYFYGSLGRIYEEDSNGTWTELREVFNSKGQGLLVFDDYLYYTTDHKLGRYGKLSGTPSFNDDFTNDDVTNVDQSNSASGQTYTLQTSISEGATHKQSFTPTREPIRFIEVNIDTVGTGNWTLTVHDSQNNEVGSITIANANLSTGDFKFNFSNDQLRVTIRNNYHFHLTSTVADGVVVTGTANDLEDCDYTSYFSPLISDDDYHPMIEHLNGMVIGNDRYLAYWDLATYNPNRVDLAPGFKVRSLTKVNEFVVAACWRGDNIDSVEEGRLYFWDGISDTFNFYQDITMGLPNAIHNYRNQLVGIYGSRGGIYGGVEDPEKVHEAPDLARGKTLEVYPGAVTTWRDRLLIGMAGSTNDAGFFQAVYEFGSKQSGLEPGLSQGFVPSADVQQATSFKITAVKGIGSDLYIGWDNNGTYGVDKVSVNGNPATSGRWESLIFDDNNAQKEKLATTLTITFEPLESGESVTPRYRINRGSWQTGTTQSTVGATSVTVDINDRFREIEFGFDIATSTTYFEVYQVYFEYDDLATEINY